METIFVQLRVVEETVIQWAEAFGSRVDREQRVPCWTRRSGGYATRGAQRHSEHLCLGRQQN